MPVSGLPPYDENNIFAKILRGEIPCRKVYEDDWAVAFEDINKAMVMGLELTVADVSSRGITPDRATLEAIEDLKG